MHGKNAIDWLCQDPSFDHIYRMNHGDRVYRVVDARDPRAAPLDFPLRSLRLNLSIGVVALICCPPGSDMPDLIEGDTRRPFDEDRYFEDRCIVDPKIVDGIHRFYDARPGHFPGHSGHPPRPIGDDAWRKVEAAAVRAMAGRLEGLIRAIDVWDALTSQMRNLDPFGDGERIKDEADRLSAKLSQFKAICDRRDRNRDQNRPINKLGEFLTRSNLGGWPSLLREEKKQELKIFQDRAFPPTKPHFVEPKARTSFDVGPPVVAKSGSVMTTEKMKRSKGRSSQKAKQKLRREVIGTWKDRSDRGFSTDVMSIAEICCCSPGQVSKILGEVRTNPRDNVSRGSKSSDGALEAFE